MGTPTSCFFHDWVGAVYHNWQHSLQTLTFCGKTIVLLSIHQYNKTSKVKCTTTTTTANNNNNNNNNMIIKHN